MNKMIKIAVGDSRTIIALPIEHAPLAAGLLAHATMYEREGWHSTSGYKLSEEPLRIEYIDGTELEPTHPKVAEAQKEVERHRKDWHDEYVKRRELEQQLTEAQAALAAIKSVTTCTATDPAADVGEDG
jgi:hypothetical protein